MLSAVAPVIAVVVFVYVMNLYAGIPVPVLILLVVALLGYFLTQHTTFGRYLYAIGGNSEAARLSGINTRTNIVAVYGLLGGLTYSRRDHFYSTSRQCHARRRSIEGTRRHRGVRDRRSQPR